MTITARTRVFAILGDPVTQSRSPLIQNAAIQAAGLDAVYVALAVSAAEFTGLFKSLARAGGGGNVTKPHKGLAAAALDRPSQNVSQTRACNTFWLENGLVVGENTDVIGFAKAIDNHFGPVAGKRVLLLGAGGAARAVVAALARGQCDRIELLARSPQRLEELRAVAKVKVTPATGETCDLIVNATSLGMRADDPLPIAADHLHGDVFDLVYSPAATPLVRAARAKGLRAFDGTEMLLHQAAAAFECWFEQDAPLEVMRTAIQA